MLDTSREEAKKIGELLLLDGTHRVAALSELLSDSTLSRDYSSKLAVLVWERVDGQTISALEVLWLSSVPNSTSSTARKLCFSNFIVKSMSIATVVDDENCLKAEPKGSSAGVAKLVDRNGHLKLLSNCGKLVSVCRANPSIGVTHLSCAGLWKMQKRKIELALDCLSSYMKLKARRVAFAKAGSSFYDWFTRFIRTPKIFHPKKAFKWRHC